MSTAYSLTISMSSATVQMLSASGSQLYLFKAAASSIAGGQPTVWLQIGNFSLENEVEWQDALSAYTSMITSFGNWVQIEASASYPIDLGSLLAVTSPSGTGTVLPDGTSGAIEVRNETTTHLTCGIAQASASGSNILCAFPLYPDTQGVIQPLEKVLAIISDEMVNPGTIIERAMGPALLVDLTDAPARTVLYDGQLGWQTGGAYWATQYPPSTLLAPLLIAPWSPEPATPAA